MVERYRFKESIKRYNKQRRLNKELMQRQAEYSAKRRKERRQFLINHLGGKCNNCDESDYEQLEFDHKDPSTKSFTIGRMLTGSLEKLMEEIKKCQLLCIKCHDEKCKREQYRGINA